MAHGANFVVAELHQERTKLQEEVAKIKTEKMIAETKADQYEKNIAKLEKMVDILQCINNI